MWPNEWMRLMEGPRETGRWRRCERASEHVTAVDHGLLLIDKWIADVLKQLANVEDRRVAVFYFLWKYFWCFILTFCKIKPLKTRVFFVQLEQWTNEWMPKRSYQRATIYFYSFYILFLGWKNAKKVITLEVSKLLNLRLEIAVCLVFVFKFVF